MAPDAAKDLASQGFVLWRGAIPARWLKPLRAAFAGGLLASDQWPVPRGHDWRHARVDTDPHVQQVCRLPALLAGVRQLLGGPFFLAQVEGREPCRGNRPQPLHRDGAGHPPQLAAALAFLDHYDAANGATQVIAGSHRGPATAPPTILCGKAGDLLLFDPDVLHGATTNTSGQPRRTLLISYAVAALYEAHQQTAALRGVQMAPPELVG